MSAGSADRVWPRAVFEESETQPLNAQVHWRPCEAWTSVCNDQLGAGFGVIEVELLAGICHQVLDGAFRQIRIASQMVGSAAAENSAMGRRYAVTKGSTLSLRALVCPSLNCGLSAGTTKSMQMTVGAAR